MQCSFSIEILAPDGLRGVEREIASCSLPLIPWVSGFNGKVILRAARDADIEWDMDSSMNDRLFASGRVPGPPSDAEARLRSLSTVLRAAGFRHQVLMDYPDGELFASIEHAWPPSGGTTVP